MPSTWDHFQHTLDWLWPRQCELCLQAIQTATGRVICQSCRTKLQADPFNTCPRCSSSIGPHTNISSSCPTCEKETYAFDGVTRLGPYQDDLRQAILKVKSYHGEPLAYELGEIAGEKLLAKLLPLTDVLVPVPLHWWRRWHRGYNQAHSIAEGLASVLNRPVQSHWVLRHKFTKFQWSVSATQRRENLKGAFRLRRGVQLHNLRILLIDDVLTTGATAHAVATLLKEAGAAQVNVCVLAHR